MYLGCVPYARNWVFFANLWNSPFLNQCTKSSEIWDLCNSYLKSDIGCIYGVHCTLEIGCFLQIYEIQNFVWFITQLVKKLHQSSLYEVIKDTLSIVLNTKRPLSDIWLLSYKQKSFGCFRKKFRTSIFSKNHPKAFRL